MNISKVIRQEWLLLRFFFTYIRYIYALRGIEHKTIPYCKLNRLQARNQEELLVASDEMERKPDWLPGFPVQINWVQINCNRGRKNPSKSARSMHLPGVYQKIIPYNTHGAHQCGTPRGCLYYSECCSSFFVGIPKMPMAEAACIMKSFTHTMPYLYPSTQWLLIIFLAPAETVHIGLMLCRLRFSVRSALQSAHWCGRYFDKRASG